MKKLLLSLIIILSMFSCGVKQSEYDALLAQKDSIHNAYKSILSENENKISELRDSIIILSYPSNQRLSNIEKLIQEKEFTKAKKEIRDFKEIFPNSPESFKCDALYAQINEELDKIEKERERLEALGFKGIKTSTQIKIDYNIITISNLSVGNRFTFDDYGDYYSYRQADRGNKYITASMSVKSSEKDPKLPQLAVYKIEGKNMTLISRFTTEFARWDDYGTYLGNDADFNNDFSKVSTVRFKIGVQVEEEITRNPYAIVIKKENNLSRNYERFDNPPVSYSGYVDYKSTLSVNDFNEDYSLIRLYNL